MHEWTPFGLWLSVCNGCGGVFGHGRVASRGGLRECCSGQDGMEDRKHGCNHGVARGPGLKGQQAALPWEKQSPWRLAIEDSSDPQNSHTLTQIKYFRVELICV
jgi:hypothetical protein